MKPELLAPAGSPEALRAAVSAGADAVYFGTQSFNARKNAENFPEETIGEAIRYCRLFGVRTPSVLNTQLYGREIPVAVELAGRLLSLGAHAFIVADIGLAAQLVRRYPGIVLHASTQTSGQNVLSAARLAEIGFRRMVAPRELPLRDIRTLCAASPIETEVFIHGALCVSHSGQCLFSSVIGGRSGNRGECAQPCRLPYRTRCAYPLSLKDLCLAEHIPALMEGGVTSFKIEGRMKSAEYVYGVVSVYRRLIDEGRGATPEEMASLARLFSRSGFTDGYFTERISGSMLGIRTEADKRTSVSAAEQGFGEKRLPLAMEGSFHAGQPAQLRGTVKRGAESFSVAVSGNVCRRAERTPTGEARIAENLSKLGATVFYASSVSVEEDGVNIPISEINGLRRALCAGLEARLVGEFAPVAASEAASAPSGFVKSEQTSAYFAFYDTVTPGALDFFDRIFVPLTEYLSHADEVSRHRKIGIAFPPVCLDHELNAVREMAKKAAEVGCRLALITGLWQCELADALGLEKHGDIRLNLFNPYSAGVYQKLGFCSLLVSPEVGASAARGMPCGIPKGYVYYGKLPLMTLEKCAIRDNFSPVQSGECRYCDTNRFSYLADRTGARFPLCREYPHRNVLYNSVPVYMADMPIAGLFRHCIFTDETRAEVDSLLMRFQEKKPPVGKFKRL